MAKCVEQNAAPTVVSIGNLAFNTEPASLRPLVFPGFKNEVVDIWCTNSVSAYVEFKTPDAAATMAKEYNGTLFGDPQQHRISVDLVDPNQVPDFNNTRCSRLSDFLDWEKRMALRKTKTVLIKGLNPNHPIRNVMKMFEPIDEDNDHNWYEPNFVECRLEKTFILNSEGDTLARFNNEFAARTFVNIYNGTYWKTNTVYLNCVPDAQLDVHLLKDGDGDATGPTAKLFIPAIKFGTKVDTLTAAFKPYKFRDVQIMPSGRQALLFANLSNAVGILSEWPRGRNYQGWKYVVKEAKGNKVNLKEAMEKVKEEKNKGDAGMEEIAVGAEGLLIQDAAAVDTVEATSAVIRLTNLAYAVTEEHVRKFVTDRGFTVQDVTVANGTATVQMPAAEVERAVLTLNRKKVLKRQVFVEKV